jgi:hypothetical protein
MGAIDQKREHELGRALAELDGILNASTEMLEGVLPEEFQPIARARDEVYRRLGIPRGTPHVPQQ